MSESLFDTVYEVTMSCISFLEMYENESRIECTALHTLGTSLVKMSETISSKHGSCPSLGEMGCQAVTKEMRKMIELMATVEGEIEMLHIPDPSVEEFILDEFEADDEASDSLPHRWKLILHNDDENTFEHVIDSLVKHCDVCLTRAEDLTFRAHCKGAVVVLIDGSRKVNQCRRGLVEEGLNVTIDLV